MAPVAMTGPVGCPVGEPPVGSTETANAAVGRTRLRSAGPRVRVTGLLAEIIPTATGFSPLAINHSSGARPVVKLWCGGHDNEARRRDVHGGGPANAAVSLSQGGGQIRYGRRRMARYEQQRHDARGRERAGGQAQTLPETQIFRERRATTAWLLACRRIELQCAADPQPDVRRRLARRNLRRKRRQAAHPELHGRGGGLTGGELALHVRSDVGIENAKNVFRVTKRRVVIRSRAHDSRHSRSCIRPRRIQLLRVPRGTWHRAASSLYVAPVKKAARTERL